MAMNYKLCFLIFNTEIVPFCEDGLIVHAGN